MSRRRPGDESGRWPRQQIGPVLRELRLRREWSLSELAQRAGVSRSHLSRLERGQSIPSFKILSRLARALGTSVTYFASVEDTSRELDDALGVYLQRLAIPKGTWAEFSRLSLEARGALVDALHHLTASHPESAPQERTLRISVLERGIPESIPLLTAGIHEFGLSPVDFVRSRAQVEEMPGDRFVICDRLVTMPGPENVDQLRLFRDLFAADLPDPMLLKWWVTSMRSALMETLQHYESRTIYPLDAIESYLQTGEWSVRIPFSIEVVREHVQATIDFLRANPRYRIGFTTTRLPLGVLGKGTGGVVVYDLAHLEREGKRGDGVALRFYGAEVTARFREYFDEIWESIPEEWRDSEAVATWLESRLAAIGQSR